MNLSSAAVVLRPRKTSEIMDLTCRVTFSLALATYVRLSLAVLLPVYVIVLTLKYLLDLTWPTVWLIAVPVVVWLEGPFTLAASRLLVGERLTLKDALKLFFRRALSYTGALLLRCVLLLLGLAICIGVFLIVPSVLLVAEASLLENASPFEAWKRSRLLASQGNSATAGFALTVAKISFVIGFELLGHGIANTVLQLGESFGSLFSSEMGTPYALFGLFASAPFMATGRFLHYIDSRTRADGWDIQVRYMALLAQEEPR